MGRRRRVALVIALTAGAALIAAPALSQSADSDRLSVTVGPVRVEFASDRNLTRTVTAFVRGSLPGEVTAVMFDALVQPGGYGWRRVPYGSTPNSLEGVITITPPSYDYVPSGGEQEFTFTLTADPAFADRARWGSFVITLVPPEASADEVAVAAAVGTQVVAFGELESTESALALDSLSVAPRDAWTIVDRLLPELPMVIGHGPAVLTASGRNTGETFLDEVTVFEIRRVSPLSLLLPSRSADVGPILRVSMRPRYTLPGQAFTDSTTSLIPLEGGSRVDALPFIGFITVRAIATGSINGIESEPRAITRTYLVFPWSEFLFLFVVYLAQREWRHRKGHKVNATDSPPPPTLRTRVRELLRRVLGRRDPAPSGRTPDASPVPRQEDDLGEGPEL